MCQRLPLTSFLILPFQRITRLKMLVEVPEGWVGERPLYLHSPSGCPGQGRVPGRGHTALLHRLHLPEHPEADSAGL